jgi:hypothetical protein
MLVGVSINRLKSGKVQICVAKPQYNSNPVQTFPSAKEARDVLLAFGIGEAEVNENLKLLPEVGPNEPLTFPPLDVPQNLLWKNGFKV